MGTAELVACELAFRSNRGCLSDAEYDVDQCGKSYCESAFCETAQCRRNSKCAAVRTGKPDPSLGLFPSESPALENVCRISGSPIWSLAHKNVFAAQTRASGRITEFEWCWT